MLKTTFKLGGLIRACSPCRAAVQHEIRLYQSTHSSGGGRRGGKILLVLGTVSVATASAAVYAKYDPEFRKLLEDKVPYADDILIKSSELIALAANLVGLSSSEPQAKVFEEPKPTPKPAAVVTPIAQDASKPASKSVAEAKAPQKISKVNDEIIKEVSRLRSAVEAASSNAVAAHNEAVHKVTVLGQELSSYTSAGIDCGELSALIKTKLVAQQAVENAGATATIAKKEIEELKNVLEKSGWPSGVQEIGLAKLSLSKAEHQLVEAEGSLHQANTALKPSPSLHAQLQHAQESLQEELGTTWEAHTKQNDELLLLDIALRFEKLRTDKKDMARLQETDGAMPHEMLDQVKREHQAELKQVREQEERRCERNMHQQAMMQAEDKIKALTAQKEFFLRTITEFVDTQLQTHTMHLGTVLDLIKKVEENVSEREQKILFGAELLAFSRSCDILVQSLYTNPKPNSDWTHQRRAIDMHINNVRRIFSNKHEDEFVNALLKVLSPSVVSEGVLTEPALKARFNNVESIARRVAYITNLNDVSVQSFIISYLRSMMLRLPVSPNSIQEIDDKPCDISELDNNALLDRARYFMDQGEVDQAVRYVNMLQGPAQYVASGWLKDAKELLEVNQVAKTLSAYASMLIADKIIKRELSK